MYLYGIEIPKPGCERPLVSNRLNCTFTELKFHKSRVETCVNQSLNCTFMELKFDNITLNLKTGISLNCTFMELEFGFLVAQSVNREALIVSLWN